MENNRVTYRRIRGRIVPIKIKNDDDRRRRNFGIGATVAGLGISSVATKAMHFAKSKAGLLESFSRRAEFKAKNVNKRNMLFRPNEPTLFQHARRQQASSRMLSMGAKAGQRAKILRRAAPHLKSIGIWTGASLIGSGLARIFESRDEDNFSGTAKELGFTAASAAALYGSGDKAIRVKTGRVLAKILSRGKIK